MKAFFIVDFIFSLTILLVAAFAVSSFYLGHWIYAFFSTLSAIILLYSDFLFWKHILRIK